MLHNVSEVKPFVDIHLNELRVNNPKKGRNEKWLQEEHNRLFQNWLGKRIFIEAGHSSTLSKLSGGPSSMVTRYTAWSVMVLYFTQENETTSIPYKIVVLHCLPKLYMFRRPKIRIQNMLL